MIGAAFGKIISSFVDNVIMPLINPLATAFGGDWRNIMIGEVKIGSFLGSVVDFLIIALVLFFAIRALQRFKRKEEAIEEPKPDTVLVQEHLADTLERLTQVLERNR